MSPRNSPHLPSVLISPAMAVRSTYYDVLETAFAGHGWTPTTVPRRGFAPGEPPASRTHDWSYGDEIDDLARAVEKARCDRPEAPVIVFGHSIGAQVALGHELTRTPADGLVTVGGALPHHVHYRFRGVHVLVMARVLVPVTTAAFGYLPRPLFGSPGARTQMREWARTAVTGRPPFPVTHRVPTPSLVVDLPRDRLAPAAAVEDYAGRYLEPDRVTRWTYTDDAVPAGGVNDHIRWVRSPGPVVERTLRWWAAVSPR